MMREDNIKTDIKEIQGVASYWLDGNDSAYFWLISLFVCYMKCDVS
jgi:hypothetical protein